MSDNDCSIMELWCLERAKTDTKKRGKWLAQAEAGMNSRAPGVRGNVKKGLSSSQCTQGQ